MSDPPPPPPPASPSPAAPSAAAGGHAATIESLVEQLRAHQRSTRVILIVGCLVLVLILLLFGLGIYSAASSNLSAQQLEPALMKRVEARTPELQRKATEAVTLALPTYQSLARERIAEIGPQLREEAKQQYDRLPDLLKDKFAGRMEELQATIQADISKQIKGKFESMAPERVDELASHLADEFQTVGEQVQSHLEDRYTQQLSRLEAVLAKFDVAPPANMSDQDLQLKLIENAALLVVHLTQNPDELPQMPTFNPDGEMTGSGGSDNNQGTGNPRDSETNS